MKVCCYTPCCLCTCYTVLVPLLTGVKVVFWLCVIVPVFELGECFHFLSFLHELRTLKQSCQPTVYSTSVLFRRQLFAILSISVCFHPCATFQITLFVQNFGEPKPHSSMLKRSWTAERNVLLHAAVLVSNFNAIVEQGCLFKFSSFNWGDHITNVNVSSTLLQICVVVFGKHDSFSDKICSKSCATWMII